MYTRIIVSASASAAAAEPYRRPPLLLPVRLREPIGAPDAVPGTS